MYVYFFQFLDSLGGVSCEQNLPEEKTYTVKFDSDGGSEVAAVEVKDGEKVTKPADPTKDGYTFKGWFNGDKEYAFETAVTSNITLKAKWEVVTYKITYELNGGTGDKDNPETYTIETDTFEIKNLVSGPAANPYFVGWYSDENFTTLAETTIKKGTTGDLSFYANWTDKAMFTVTFNFVGVEKSSSVNVEEGKALTSEQLESVKSKISSDYVFVDFYTNKECTTKFDVTTTITADSTVYVKVKVNEIKKFTVTFESNGGSKVAAAEVKDGEKVKKPADPTKDGYTFKGWFNGDKEYDFGTAVTANITLKAKWEVVEVVEAKEELSADGNVLTITNPKIENEWGATVEKNSVITFSGNSAVKFVHKDLLSFDKIEFQYTVEKADANDAKISVKAADLKLEENKYKDCAYPTLNKEGGSLVYSMSELKSKQAGMEYIILANNSNDNDWTNGPAWDADWKLTITKIILSKTVAGAAIKEFGKGETVKLVDLGINSENAANYLLRVSFTLDDPEKKGWGAGAIADSGWTDLGISDLPVNEEGFIDIEISDIIVKSDSFLINWWASYATLLKCEIIKKQTFL